MVNGIAGLVSGNTHPEASQSDSIEKDLKKVLFAVHFESLPKHLTKIRVHKASMKTMFFLYLFGLKCGSGSKGQGRGKISMAEPESTPTYPNVSSPFSETSIHSFLSAMAFHLPICVSPKAQNMLNAGPRAKDNHSQ